MIGLLRLISSKTPASYSSTMRCIASGARFWDEDADFASLRQSMNSPGSLEGLQALSLSYSNRLEKD